MVLSFSSDAEQMLSATIRLDANQSSSGIDVHTLGVLCHRTRFTRPLLCHSVNGRTLLSTMDDQSRGLRTCSKAPNSKHLRRQRDVFVRSNTKTSVVATVCGSHGLQPYLPHILLVRTTRSETPPAHLPNAFAVTGSPLEY